MIRPTPSRETSPASRSSHGSGSSLCPLGPGPHQGAGGRHRAVVTGRGPRSPSSTCPQTIGPDGSSRSCSVRSGARPQFGDRGRICGSPGPHLTTSEADSPVPTASSSRANSPSPPQSKASPPLATTRRILHTPHLKALKQKPTLSTTPTTTSTQIPRHRPPLPPTNQSPATATRTFRGSNSGKPPSTHLPNHTAGRIYHPLGPPRAFQPGADPFWPTSSKRAQTPNQCKKNGMS